MTRTTTLWLALVLVLVVAAIACGCMGTAPATTAGDIKKFSSTDEIRQYIKENAAKVQDTYYGAVDGSLRNAEVAMSVPSAVAQGAAKSSAEFSGISSAATDYSTTNIQVAGVDEPDFVKNDGRYIYIISGSSLVIVDAYPAQGAKILSDTQLGDNVKEIFVSGDRLVLFTTGTADLPARTASEGTGSMEKVSAMPRHYRSNPVTHATVYDISDRKNPNVMKEYTIDRLRGCPHDPGDRVHAHPRERVLV